jgi:hypothetical protein
VNVPLGAGDNGGVAVTKIGLAEEVSRGKGDEDQSDEGAKNHAG